MNQAQIIQADAGRLPLADRSVDLVFGSPPYCDARTYGIGAQRGCLEWVSWMLDVTTECQRVSRGPVVWVAAGVTRDRNYWPACEGLMWEWWRRGGDCQLYRPCYWHRVGIPGSGGKDWFRADVEYVMCFKRPGELAWSDNKAMGHPPRWAPGGAMSHRITHSIGKPRPSHRTITRHRDGMHNQDQEYQPPAIANPGTLVRTVVGGGAMGSKLAHENEAPFPEKLAEFFVRSLCPPGGIVLDPFSGSGTTASVATAFGRKAIASDIRANQCALTKRRLAEVQLRMDVA